MSEFTSGSEYSMQCAGCGIVSWIPSSAAFPPQCTACGSSAWEGGPPPLWWCVTYTTTTDHTAVDAPAKTYTEGFDDGWTARGAADGKPQSGEP